MREKYRDEHNNPDSPSWEIKPDGSRVKVRGYHDPESGRVMFKETTTIRPDGCQVTDNQVYDSNGQLIMQDAYAVNLDGTGTWRAMLLDERGDKKREVGGRILLDGTRETTERNGQENRPSSENRLRADSPVLPFMLDDLLTPPTGVGLDQGP